MAIFGIVLPLVLVALPFVLDNVAAIITIAALGTLLVLLIWAGLLIVNPNVARVLQLLGRYAGTITEPGLWWVNPITYPRRGVSRRVRNFESARLKVNDLDGNPIEIAAVVVWRVERPADAVFAVDEYEQYVALQAETSIRKLATTYPYDAHDGVPALRGGLDANIELTSEIQERVERAGVAIIEARITHLAYAPEIAQAMLRRQQAGAVVAARTRIVDGAVGMVEMALDRLSERDIVDLDEERKAHMVSNLLVVLCSEQQTSPVVNAGSLY